jgi:hypothetical protein
MQRTNRSTPQANENKREIASIYQPSHSRQFKVIYTQEQKNNEEIP